MGIYYLGGTDSISTFINNFNNEYNENITMSNPSGSDLEQIEDLVNQIQGLGYNIGDVIFNFLNQTGDPNSNIISFFGIW